MNPVKLEEEGEEEDEEEEEAERRKNGFIYEENHTFSADDKM